MAAAVIDAPASLEWQHVSFDEAFAETARVVGIRGFSSPSLEAVERRRSELWTIAFLTLCVLAVALVLMGLSGEGASRADHVVRMPAFRVALVAATLGLALYVLEK